MAEILPLRWHCTTVTMLLVIICKEGTARFCMFLVSSCCVYGCTIDIQCGYVCMKIPFFLQSSPEHIFMQAIQNHLFPSNTYSYVSGGLPINILDLKVCVCFSKLIKISGHSHGCCKIHEQCYDHASHSHCGGALCQTGDMRSVSYLVIGIQMYSSHRKHGDF